MKIKITSPASKSLEGCCSRTGMMTVQSRFTHFEAKSVSQKKKIILRIKLSKSDLHSLLQTSFNPHLRSIVKSKYN